jgi:two-component system, cell cycle sensor histidine kinase and response regulator CckA
MSSFSPATRKTELARLQISRLSLSETFTLQDIFKQTMKISSDTLMVDRAGVWLYNDERTAITCACLYERKTDHFSHGITLQVEDFPDYFDTLERRKVVPAEFAKIDPRTSSLKESYLDPLGITSMLDAPLYFNEMINGVVCHEHIGPVREWSTEERDFAASVSDLITLKIKNKRLREAQAKLNQQEKVETHTPTIQFAAGLAHDLRNLLTIVIGNADMISADQAVSKSTRDKVRNILNASERGMNLVNELTILGSHRAGRPRVLSLTSEVRKHLDILRCAAGDQFLIEIVSERDDDQIFVDPIHLERILMNLVVNARDAMTEGGLIEIGIEKTPDKDGVELFIRDRGCGMEVSVIERIFDPFFTTKSKSKGTGLGLSIVKRVVELAGGQIQVNSQVGQGTTMLLSFPQVSSESTLVSKASV